MTNLRQPARLTSTFMIILVCVLASVRATPVGAANWAAGDVFVAVGGGTYFVYTNAGVFRESISDGLGGYTTGCAFNSALNKFYTTNFGNTKVIVYDAFHPHSKLQTINTDATSPGGASESIVFGPGGNFYVAHPDGNRLLHKYGSAGNLIQTYAPAIETRGVDWLDLATDGCTMYYTSEGTAIKRFDVCTNTQMFDFASGLHGAAYALRILPSGGVLVADTVDIHRLDASGVVVQTYDVLGEDAWFALNLDPNGSSFWAGDFGSANFYRFNIASGGVEVGPINTGTGTLSLHGICLANGTPTCISSSECDDGNPCSADACSNSICVHAPIPYCGIPPVPALGARGVLLWLGLAGLGAWLWKRRASRKRLGST